MGEDQKLESLVKPLMEHLENNYHPHAAIVITVDRAVVVESTLSIPKCIIISERENNGELYLNGIKQNRGILRGR